MKKVTLLVIDEQPARRKLLAKRLREHHDDVEIVYADPGGEALEICRHVQPDCALVYSASETQAKPTNDLIQQICHDRSAPPFPILLITAGPTTAHDRADAYQAGVKVILSTPLNYHELEEIIRSYVAEKLAADKLRKLNDSLRTELKEKTIGLQSSEKELLELASLAGEFIWESDREGKLTMVTDHASTLFGLPKHELIGKRLFDLVEANQLPKWETWFAEIVAAGLPFQNIELQGVNFVGKEVWQRLSGSPIQDEDSRVLGYRGMSLDMTEQVTAEQALRQSERLLRMHIERTPLAILNCSPDAEITGWNHAAESLFGYTDEEAIGQIWYELLVPAKTYDAIRTAWSNLLREEGGTRSTLEHVTKTGLERICNWYNTPLVNAEGDVITVTSMVQDITDRTFAEDALHEAQERYRLAVSAGQVGVWDWDLQRQDVFIDASLEEMLGYDEEALQGNVAGWLSLFSAEDRHAFEDKIREHLDGLTEDVQLEHRLRTATGEERWFLTRGLAVHDENGNAYRLWGTTTDITEQKRVQEQLAAARDQELAIGSEIQQRLLVGRPPRSLPRIDIAANTIPTLQVDGDFYDFVEFNETCVDVFLGDVMGKGVPAALLGAATKAETLRAISHLVCSQAEQPPPHALPTPETIINALHEEMCGRLITVGSFVTMIYARFDLAAMRMDYVDCGHTPTIFYRSRIGTCEPLKGRNTPLGFHEKEIYKQSSIHLVPGDAILFYSDGFMESANALGQEFGVNRLAKVLAAHAHESAAKMVEILYETIIAYAGDNAHNDDLTCMVVKLRNAEGDVEVAQPPSA